MTAQDALQKKIKVLNELMWEKTLPWSDVATWLSDSQTIPRADLVRRPTLYTCCLISVSSRPQ